MYFDESEYFNILLCGPITLLDYGVEMIEPLLSTVIDIPEVFRVGSEEQLKGNPTPVDFSLIHMCRHYLREEVNLLWLPGIRDDVVLLTDEQLDLVLDEA